ncbi:hypothetical protein XM38_012270 [Halomicronema hongdechloris C2206]|uniref:Uncharacterized protein n=1 Tax=Halomicronema hongdechloris C2206 TaxID=1641165 RepID=A0A1Z3HJ16_9CYAN|nr:hypothetical protein [Halomicronema hongdechloris]ASC70290.1 hypothetical protein XM38_012270 [Halomicronema hongdechloris C2206]
MADETILATFKIDKDTWHQFKARAKSRNSNASAVLKSLVYDYLDGKLDGLVESQGETLADAIAALSEQVKDLDRRLGKSSVAA